MDTSLISPAKAVVYLGCFAVFLIAITVCVVKLLGKHTIDDFLVAERKVPWWVAGPSIAAGWTWAVALMVSVQLAYQNGIAGIFWFTAPNILAVLIYMWLGPRIRRLLPNGYSLPEWIHYRFQNKAVTYLYLFAFFYYQVMAVVVQLYAGGMLLAVSTGLNIFFVMPAMLLITLAYCLPSGIKASLATDFLQLAVLLILGGLIVFMVAQAGGWHFNLIGVTAGGGINPFTAQIACTAGVIQTIGLLSGSICDQPFWQRCLAIREGQIGRSFVFGGLLFALIPLGLSVLGFTAGATKLNLPHDFDMALIGFIVVKHLLPTSIASLFVFILLAALCSSLDSALVASSALYSLIQTKLGKVSSNQFSIKHGRMAMIGIGVIGLFIGLTIKLIPGFSLKYLWWFLNTIAACIALPTVLSLFWSRLSAKGILIGSGLGLFLGLPAVIAASMAGADHLVAAAYLSILIVSLLSCLLSPAQELSG